MIDLHLHTPASDGRCSPSELARRAEAAGVRILAVTDHDTTDGIGEAASEASRLGLRLVPGIEITAVEDGRDVHMLGYFFDAGDDGFQGFLQGQRQQRIERIVEMAQRLERLGMPVAVDQLIGEARRDSRRALGRPKLAQAMVDAGHVADIREAFDRWLTVGAPAFVTRAGATPEDVIQIVHRAGGLVSLAHPGRTRIDARIGPLRDAGLDALEVHHSDHDEAAVERYRQLARTFGLLVTGGSDFHGDPTHGLEPGASFLPREEWLALLDASGTHDR